LAGLVFGVKQLLTAKAPGQVITGPIVSWTVIVCDAVEVLPHASVELHVRVKAPVPPQPRMLVSIEVKLAEPHPSFALGVLKVGVAGHWIVALGPTPEITGGTLSITVIVCAALVLLPHGSVAVHVRVKAPVLPQEVTLESMKLKLAVLHASVALGVLNTGTAGHTIVAAAPTPVITGGTLSITVIVWKAVAVLPHASVEVQVRVKAPVPPQAGALVSTELKLAVLHASLALGVLNTGVAGHTIVAAGPTPAITGGVVSITVIVCAVTVVLPHASVAVHVRVKAPVPPQASTLVSADVIDDVPHASVAIGELNTGDAGHWIVALAPTPEITGPVVSITVIDCESEAELPHASVAVHVRTVVYAFAHAPGVVTSAAMIAAALHRSVAVGVAKAGVAGHWIVDGNGTGVIVGGVVSITTIVCVTCEVLLQASTAVHVRVTL